jgi:hypothetical protein
MHSSRAAPRSSLTRETEKPGTQFTCFTGATVQILTLVAHFRDREAFFEAGAQM